MPNGHPGTPLMWTDRQTYTTENITFLQPRWRVLTKHKDYKFQNLHQTSKIRFQWWEARRLECKILNPPTSTKLFMTKLQNLLVALVNTDSDSLWTNKCNFC